MAENLLIWHYYYIIVDSKMCIEYEIVLYIYRQQKMYHINLSIWRD